MKRFVVLVVAAPLLASLACSSSVDSMSIDKTCVRTACDERHARDASQCSACMSACSSASYSCNGSSACSVSCSTSTCSAGEEDECRAMGFVVTLPDEGDPDLQRACERSASQQKACGVTGGLDAWRCSTYAKIERPEMAAAYDCFANLPCDADPSSCTVAPSTFGDELCGAIEDRCPGTCPALSPRLQAALNDEGAWLRDDAKDAAASCSKQASCGDVRDCLKAFVGAVF